MMAILFNVGRLFQISFSLLTYLTKSIRYRQHKTIGDFLTLRKTLNMAPQSISHSCGAFL
jgi:hypothetical protein